jgi:hypothetical protein
MASPCCPVRAGCWGCGESAANGPVYLQPAQCPGCVTPARPLPRHLCLSCATSCVALLAAAVPGAAVPSPLLAVAAARRAAWGWGRSRYRPTAGGAAVAGCRPHPGPSGGGTAWSTPARAAGAGGRGPQRRCWRRWVRLGWGFRPGRGRCGGRRPGTPQQGRGVGAAQGSACWGPVGDGCSPCWWRWWRWR